MECVVETGELVYLYPPTPTHRDLEAQFPRKGKTEGPPSGTASSDTFKEKLEI